MKKITFSLLTGIIFCSAIIAQDCPMYFPDAVNSQLRYEQYDKKGNVAGSSLQKVTDITKSGNSYAISVSSERFDAKGKSLGTMNLTARCEGGIYFIDMKNLMDPKSMESYKDMEMKIEGGNLEMPSTMKAGDMLKNGDMKIVFSNSGMTVLNMTFNVTNRKVEAVENVTTPAGTFECYKISFDVATKMMINVRTKGTEWYSKGTGLVKSETFDSQGKLLGSNILTEIKK